MFIGFWGSLGVIVFSGFLRSKKVFNGFSGLLFTGIKLHSEIFGLSASQSETLYVLTVGVRVCNQVEIHYAVLKTNSVRLADDRRVQNVFSDQLSADVGTYLFEGRHHFTDVVQDVVLIAVVQQADCKCKFDFPGIHFEYYF
jgi:hypothetical protein